MERQLTHASSVPPARIPSHEGLWELLRKPAVQLLLLLTAAGQIAAVQGKREMGRSGTDGKLAVRLTPVVVTPAAEQRITRLAAQYRARGYHVPADLARDIHEAATRNGIDPEIAFGLVRTESEFKNSATSRVGAMGLTQLMPSTARWLEPGIERSDLRDQETNLRIGFAYLRQLIDKYDGDTRMALLAYNRGPGTVDRVLKKGGDPDNGYADLVLGRKRRR